MLNAIGLDNDGIDHFIAHHLPYLRTLPTAIIANIAGKTRTDSSRWPRSSAAKRAWRSWN